MNEITKQRQRVSEFYKSKPDHHLPVSATISIQLVPDGTMLSKCNEGGGIIITRQIENEYKNGRLALTDAEAIDLWRFLEMLYTDDGK